jgi:hypothetical protein
VVRYRYPVEVRPSPERLIVLTPRMSSHSALVSPVGASVLFRGARPVVLAQ